MVFGITDTIINKELTELSAYTMWEGDNIFWNAYICTAMQNKIQ